MILYSHLCSRVYVYDRLRGAFRNFSGTYFWGREYLRIRNGNLIRKTKISFSPKHEDFRVRVFKDFGEVWGGLEQKLKQKNPREVLQGSLVPEISWFVVDLPGSLNQTWRIRYEDIR